MSDSEIGIQYGLAIRNFVGPNETPDVDEIVRYSQRAEALGFESLWAWDHVLLGVKPAFPVLDSLSVLTAIAMQTSRIKLGTGILVLPLRNPVVLAKVLSTLDHISKGRLVLGVASGWYAREFNAIGIPFKERGRIFDRNLEILRLLWEEDFVTVQVDEFNLKDAALLPKPYQKPHPPVLIGGYVDRVLRRVARTGNGWLTYFYTPEGFTNSWQKILGFAKEYGRDPKTLTATNQLAIYVGPPKAEADPPMRQWLSTEWDVASWSDSTIDHAIRGTPEECAEQLRPHIRAGVNRIIFIPYHYQLEQLELITKEVIPRI